MKKKYVDKQIICQINAINLLIYELMVVFEKCFKKSGHSEVWLNFFVSLSVASFEQSQQDEHEKLVAEREKHWFHFVKIF